jgi:hypothetical protein
MQPSLKVTLSHADPLRTRFEGDDFDSI